MKVSIIKRGMLFALYGLFFQLNAQVSAPFVVDFSQHSVGSYTTAMAQQDFPPPVSGSYWYYGMDQGRSEIVDEDGNKVLRVKYPAGNVGPNDAPIGGGIQIKWPLPETANEMWLTYRLKFEDGFEFVKGGKLPGLCGGTAKTSGDPPTEGDGWSARAHWSKDGAATQFMYFVEQAAQYGDHFKWDKGETQCSFIPGQWHTIVNQIILNTIPEGSSTGNRDGILRTWFDGELVLEKTDLRLVDFEDQRIDLFYFSTFHGGSDASWAPSTDSYIRYDDIIVSAATATVGSDIYFPNMVQNETLENATSITLNGIWNSTQIEDLFDTGINPNLLKYIPQGTTISSDLTNVVFVDGDSYTSNNGLILTLGEPYHCPVAFNLGEDNNISIAPVTYDVTKKNGNIVTPCWYTICLPFDANVYKGATLLTPHSTANPQGTFWLREFTGADIDNVTFTDVVYAVETPVIKANTTYIISFPGSGWGTGFDLADADEGDEVTITYQPVAPSDGIVPVTSTNFGNTPDGSNYTFMGGYQPIGTEVAENYYVLNRENNVFRKDEANTIAPFSAYFTVAPAGRGVNLPPSLSIGPGGFGELTNIENPATIPGLRVYSNGENLVIESPVAQRTTIYDIGGRAVRTVKLAEGVNSVTGLQKGTYIVERIKVVF